MTLVIAKAAGFHGHLREAGDRFNIPDDEELGNWMVEANKDGSPKLTKDQKSGKEEAPVIPQINPTPNTAPFTPANQTYTAKHIAGGNFAVIDQSGTQVGEVFHAVKGENGKAKTLAMQEADRLNALQNNPASVSPIQAAQAEEQVSGQDDENDDGLPDA